MYSECKLANELKTILLIVIITYLHLCGVVCTLDMNFTVTKQKKKLDSILLSKLFANPRHDVIKLRIVNNVPHLFHNLVRLATDK